MSQAQLQSGCGDDWDGTGDGVSQETEGDSLLPLAVSMEFYIRTRGAMGVVCRRQVRPVLRPKLKGVERRGQESAYLSFKQLTGTVAPAM